MQTTTPISRSCERCGTALTGKDAKRAKYCSRSCAASVNNSLYPKRVKKEHGCIDCGRSISCNTALRCNDCYALKRVTETGARTIGSTYGAETRSRHRYQNVRNHAHSVMNLLKKDAEECAVCRYDRYVELCHVVPISSFSDDDLLSQVNDPTNLVWLCPNHHKELDLGLLRL